MKNQLKFPPTIIMTIYKMEYIIHKQTCLHLFDVTWFVNKLKSVWINLYADPSPNMAICHYLGHYQNT